MNQCIVKGTKKFHMVTVISIFKRVLIQFCLIFYQCTFVAGTSFHDASLGKLLIIVCDDI